MRQTTQITIEHIVVASNRSFEQVTQLAQALIGPSGFTIESSIEEGVLLRLAGKSRQMCQYLIGSPRLPVRMFGSRAEAALYASLRLVVYEDDAGRTCVAYDRFTSQLAKSPHPQMAPVAQLVEQKLEAPVARVTGDGEGKQP